MKPIKIKVDHYYSKFAGQTKGKLVGVELVSSTELSEESKMYHSSYYCNSTLKHKQPYHNTIPNGTLILATFIGEDHVPFSTLTPLRAATWTAMKNNLGAEYSFEVKRKSAHKDTLQDPEVWNGPVLSGKVPDPEKGEVPGTPINAGQYSSHDQ